MQIETKRHIFHIITGSALALAYYYYIITVSLLCVLLILSIVFTTFTAHYGTGIFTAITQHLERKKTQAPGIGIVYFLTGALLSALFFDHAIATASILILSVGDGVSGLIRTDRHEMFLKKHKSWKGLLTAIGASTLATFWLVGIWQALIVSALVLFWESTYLKISPIHIDDNLYIPLLAGLLLTLLL